MYLCYSTTVGTDEITGLQVEAVRRKCNPYGIPPGYTKVEGDLNKGAGGKYIYTTNEEIGKPSYYRIDVLVMIVGLSGPRHRSFESIKTATKELWEVCLHCL